MKKLVILDLDGTLIDSLADLTDATNRMRQAFNLPSLTLLDVRKLVGEGARRLVERALPGLPQEEIEQGLEIFLRYNYEHIADRTVPYPGVRETLRILGHRGYVLTVVSNKSASHCREILRLLDLDRFFTAVLGADSVAERKPSPEPLLHLMRELGYSAEETVMVGDSINDVKAGRAAGVSTIGCEYGYGPREELEMADCVVSSFPDVLNSLEGTP